MKPWDFTEKKFLSLSRAHRHKMASELLKEVFTAPSELANRTYQKMELWLDLPVLDWQNAEEVSGRFHLHLKQANLSLPEHSLLQVKNKDKPSTVPFLPIHIFLYSLRSAFNVGTILS